MRRLYTHIYVCLRKGILIKKNFLSISNRQIKLTNWLFFPEKQDQKLLQSFDLPAFERRSIFLGNLVNGCMPGRLFYIYSAYLWISDNRLQILIGGVVVLPFPSWRDFNREQFGKIGNGNILGIT